MTKRREATPESAEVDCFTRWENSSKKGTAKWNKAMHATSHSQPPSMRGKYHAISDGRLPDQMIKN